MAFQTINGKQIREHVLEDKHIKSKLSESVLDIKWDAKSHSADILRNKTIIDYVQSVDKMVLSVGTDSVQIRLSLDKAPDAMPGVMLDTPFRFRDKNGDPLRHDGKELIGKIVSADGEDTSQSPSLFMYTVQFFDHSGQPFTFQSETEIEFLYPIKTNLWDAAEDFASNERFVDGAVDIRTRLDLLQLAKDLYGENYVYNANGRATLPVLNEKVHVHGKQAIPISQEASTIEFATLTGTELESIELIDGIDDIEVYYNGNLQAETYHYQLIKDHSNKVTGIDFTPDRVMDGDLVIVKWTLYNKAL